MPYTTEETIEITDPRELYLGAAVEVERPERVCLTVLGRPLVLTMPDGDTATEFVNDWKEHLEHEWQTLRETNSSILEAFAAKLLLEGVPQTTIDSALRAVQAEAARTAKANG